MLLLFVIAGLLAAFLWIGWKKPVIAKGEWRLGAALCAVALLVVAAALVVRGGYLPGSGLLLGGLLLAWLARSRRPAGQTASGLSDGEARSLLGIGPEASPADIKAAHARLIRRLHPDVGGTSGLAAQLNAARDRLLNR